MHESEKWSEVTQLCLTPSDPMACSLPDSSVHGIFQARVLEWGAIAFSGFITSNTQSWLSFLFADYHPEVIYELNYLII